MQTTSFCRSVPRLLAFAVASVLLVTVRPGNVAALALVPPTSKFGRSCSDIARRHFTPAVTATTAMAGTRRTPAGFSPVCVLSLAASSSLVAASEEVRVGCGDRGSKVERAANHRTPPLPLHRIGNGSEDEVGAGVDAICPVESMRSLNGDGTVSGFASSIVRVTEAGGDGLEAVVTNEERVERERVPLARGVAERLIFEGHRYDIRRDDERPWHTPAPVGSKVRLAFPRVGLRPGRRSPYGGSWTGSCAVSVAARTASLGPLFAGRDGTTEEKEEEGYAAQESLEDDGDGVDKFDGGGFVKYLAPYAAALIASIAVTAAFLNFLLTEY